MRILQMAHAQIKEPFFNGNGAFAQLLAIDETATELVPESKEPGMLGESVPAELLHDAVLAQIQHAQESAFQVRPAKLGFAGVILKIGAKTITAQDSLECRPQHTNQNFTAAVSHRVDHILQGNKRP